MRVTTKSAILLILPLMIIGLVACGSDSTTAASQNDGVIGDAPSVSIVEETHDEDDEHAVAIEGDHDDGGHAEGAVDEHDDDGAHAAAIDDHAEDDKPTGHAHADMNGPVNPDALVTHITAAEFAYGTSEFEVETGEPFSVQISNQGMLEHDITIEGFEGEFGLHVMPGEDNIATYATDEAGEFTYYCTVLGHREAGMTGTLVVSAAHDDADGHHDDAEVMSEDADDEHDDVDTAHDETDGHHDEDVAGA